MRYGFIHTHKPVLDDASLRSFEDKADYRQWCEITAAVVVRLWPRLSIARPMSFPVCHSDDIIASKQSANRAKERESLPRLRAFRDYWQRTRS